MSRSIPVKYGLFLLLFIWILPVSKDVGRIFLPFLLGAALALTAEPVVTLLGQKLHLPRPVAAGIGVSAVCILWTILLTLLFSLVFKQFGQLTAILPAIGDAVGQSASMVKGWLLSLTGKMPQGFGSAMEHWITISFEDKGGMLQQVTGKITQLAGSAIGRVSSGFIGVLTTVLSAFMISMRLPQLREKIRQRIPDPIRKAAKEFKKTMGRWIFAQGKLAGVAFVILWIGFMLLKIQNHLLWAAMITTVDILPVLGVGTVLLPWSLICYLQADPARAVGLVCIYLVIWLVRSVLEPRFVGKQLGLDPLVTLFCIYAGFRLWGFAGILLAPMVAVSIVLLRQHGIGEYGSEDT